MHQPDLDELLAQEAAAQSVAFESHDHREGIRAFIEKRTPRFIGR